MRSYLFVVVGAILVGACASTGGKEGEPSRVVETSSQDGKRAFWTYDPIDIKKLREEQKDSAESPKFAYFVAQSIVGRTDLVPNCYQMARTRAAGEFAASIAQKIQDANAISESQDATEFQRQLEAHTKTFLVGSTIANKTWAKVEEDGETKVTCWVLMSVPRKHLEALQKDVLKMLQDGAKGDNELKQRAKSAVEQMSASN
jgi:hypothetical protein